MKSASCNNDCAVYNIPHEKCLNYCDVPESRVLFHNIIYFVVVTLSTVGYGDITIDSPYAKLCVIILVILAVVLIPNQSSEV